MASPASASAATCQTSGPSSAYSINVCLTAPAGGATVSGDTTVSATGAQASGTMPGIQRLVFYVDGTYALTDYEPPYTFSLPTARWVDGSHLIEVEALLRDGFTSQRAGVTVNFNNGVTTPPVNTNQWTPTTGTSPTAGKPLVMAAAGDGAGGETGAQNVVNRIASWSPNLFLYLGDVYEKGSPSEFKNWYGSQSSTLFGQFRSITDPVVGNHEYSKEASSTAAGYFDFWDNIPHYYSYDTAGWHLIALDSSSQFGQASAGSAQYNWLVGDLAAHQGQCTIAYWHHPPYNIGPEGPSTRMDEIWSLLAQNHVAIVLTGHDHDYQRWVPMDGSGTPAPDGVTEFVAGTGGHSEQSFVGTDSRVASAFSNTQFGALRMELNQSGAAYQFVTAGGTRLDSGSVQCPGTATDTTAPSVPTGVSATAPSRQEVALSWSESTDNVGVTGYDIYRNGTFLKTVGPDTSTHDGTVAPGTTYTYTVKARDAAGNLSDTSASTQSQTPSLGVLFSDGFESGGFAGWGTNNNHGMVIAPPGPVFAGSYSAHMVKTSGTGSTWVTKLLAGQTDLYYQTRVYVASQGTASPIDLMRFRSSASSPAALVSILRSAGGKIQFKNETSGGTTSAQGAAIPTGSWVLVGAHVTINGASSHVDVSVNGTQTLSSTVNLGTTPIGWIDLGEPSTSSTRTYDVYFDEVAADSNPVPDLTAPSAPTSVHATPKSGLEVDLSWTASTDDVAVARYDIYRNGQQIATAPSGSTTWADLTVGPQSSYFYQVRAEDAAGNTSDLSDLATVTTPAVFGDGFETGDMSQWDAGSTGLTPAAATGFTGSYAARANALGTAAYAVKSLAASPNELYYRIRFRLDSQSSSQPVYLMRFRTASSTGLGSPIFTAYVTNTGALAIRNDVSNTFTTSNTTIATGVWYELQAHLLVQGATGQSDVWLDGDPVPALSKVDNFGTTGIGKLQLGDDTTHTFTALFDDVLATGSFIEDDTPPSPPSGLKATTVASNQVALSWTSATDNIAVTSYDIYRDGSLIHNVAASTTSYTDTSVASGLSYRYEVRANDKAGNTSDASNPLIVNTPGVDTSPPTQPTGLKATAVSSQEVDLSWTAATDNVGVTTYRIFRNGNLMTTVSGSRTSYADTATIGDNTYTYTVQAADAAGNLSTPSASASATTPHQAYFADGFENGLAAWTTTSGVTTQGTTGDTGAFAARATSTGTAAWAWHALLSTQTDVTYNIRFKSNRAWSGTTTLIKMRNATGGQLFGVQVSSSGKLGVRNDVAGTNTPWSTTTLTTGTWYSLQAHLVIAGASSSYQVKINGAAVAGLSQTDNFGTTPIGRISLGDSTSGKTYDLYYDDVDVEIPVNATPPSNVTLPAISGTAVDQQTLTATTGTWNASPGTVYVYQWRDCDSSGASCTDIAGATDASYALRPSDIGHTIRVVVRATNGAGSVSATSNATGVVTAAGPRNLTAPTITGAPYDGQQLAAATGSWLGTAPISYAYQWQRCNSSGTNCTAITSATGATFTLGVADVGSTIKVVVTATNTGGSAAATSAATNVVAGVAPTNTALPTISGTTNDGQTLSATSGSWTGTQPISSAYQWQRCDSTGANCTDIPSATNPTYTLVSADVGATIDVRVTATNAGGSTSATSATAGPVRAVLPVNVTNPLISGTLQDGQTLSADKGSWSGTTPIVYGYQWRRCDSTGANCNTIAPATNPTYTLTGADVGAKIVVLVTATNAAGSASATSPATATVGSTLPVNSTPPSITGNPTDGQQLTGSNGSWSGTQPINYADQWQRCDSNGGNCTNIASATNGTYTLTSSDIGSTVKLVVTATNPSGSANASSAATNLVAAAAPANTTAPSISGAAQDGQTLTVDKGTWTGTPPINYAYRWQRCAADGSNCSDVAGATATSYTLSSADIGSAIRAVVTASNAGGLLSAPAAATNAVAGVGPANTSGPSISGTAQDGQTLTADKGTWTGSTPLAYAYQWRDCDTSGQNCTDIGGATGTSYTVQSSDVNQRIIVAVTATNSTSSATASSAATAAVAGTPPSNVTAPTITGTAKAGRTLTADRGSWAGTVPIDYSYQWESCAPDGTNCANIAGAIASTYVIASGDVGQALVVVVSAHNSADTTLVASARTSTVAPADLPPANTAGPSISGTAQDGQTLTADPGMWTGTAPLHYGYQWRDCDAGGSNCTDISGATNTSYVLRSSDVGSTIVVRITASNDSGSANADSNSTAVVAGTAPSNTSAPSVSGSAQVGSTLTADKGAWSGTTPISYAYQWQRCDADGTNCSDLTGATGGSYTVQSDDFGDLLHVVVTATNAIDTSSVISANTATVTAAPTNNTAPSISGTPQDGSTLTADHGTWSGSDPISYGYQWQRCAGDGSGCADVTGATNATYDLHGADAGSALRVVVTATNSVGSAFAHSDPTAAVAGSGPSNVTPPSISGTMLEGNTLTADAGTWNGTGAMSYAYQWRRCNSDGSGCADVAGATASNYLLSTDDTGKALVVRVTGTNSAGSSSATSASVVLRTPLFWDGFESGVIANPKWTNFGLTTWQTNAYAGSWSAHALSTAGTAAYATANITPQTDLTYRLRFRNNASSWPPTGVYLLKLRTAANGSVVGVYVDKNGKLAYKNDTPNGLSFSSQASVASGVWYQLVVHVTMGTTGAIDMTLGGTHVAGFPRTENFGTTPIGKVQLGENTTARNFDISEDEVVVDSAG